MSKKPARGPRGIPGRQGPIGKTGARGLTGARGAKGAPGTTGATGARGATGPRGATGDTGAAAVEPVGREQLLLGVQDHLDNIYRELDIQMTRMSDLQMQFDELRNKLRRLIPPSN